MTGADQRLDHLKGGGDQGADGDECVAGNDDSGAAAIRFSSAGEISSAELLVRTCSTTDMTDEVEMG